MKRPEKCDLFATFFLKMLLDMLHNYMHSRGCLRAQKKKKFFDFDIKFSQSLKWFCFNFLSFIEE